MTPLRCRGLAAALLCVIVTAGCGGGGGGSSNGGGTSNPPPPPVSTTAVTSLKMTSDPGDFVGDGRTYSYSQANADFTVAAQGGLLSVEVLGDEKWGGVFQMPSGYSTLATGTYNNLALYQLHDPVIGGLRWTSDGRSCAGVNGSVTIRKAIYEGSTLTELDLQFTQYCDGRSFALRGELRWNAKDPTAPPGPKAPPAGLWQPPNGATPSSGTYVYLESQPDDYIGAGGTYLYTPTTALIRADAGLGNVQVRLAGDEYWYGTFQGMSSLSRLEPGYYGNLRWYPDHNPAVGGIDWSGEGRTCGAAVGWFVVDSITYRDSALAAAEIRFEQRCVGRTGVLRGKVRWDSNDQSQAPGPVAPPPNLWQPAPGTTPTAGNYVYFEVPNGNFVDSGKAFLYTQANSILKPRALTPGMAMEIEGDKSWVIDFWAMRVIDRLQVGYYGNLQQAPFHNPAVGGIAIRGDDLLCGRGWFVVDAVVYEGDALKSIDLRFEIDCGTSTSLLRGKIHWSDDDPTVPPGPTVPPVGLWEPAPGVTPAAGTFAYFESSIDPAVATRTFLYTPDNASFFVDAGAALMLARINASDAAWSGALQGMNSIRRLELGYYGDLQRNLFHNPAKGGLEWGSTVTGGCNELTGWFVIDAVTYEGLTLTSIDARFEQRCVGTNVMLRGRFRWSR